MSSTLIGAWASVRLFAPKGRAASTSAAAQRRKTSVIGILHHGSVKRLFARRTSHCGTWPVARGTWPVARGPWPVARGTWHRGTWPTLAHLHSPKPDVGAAAVHRALAPAANQVAGAVFVGAEERAAALHALGHAGFGRVEAVRGPGWIHGSGPEPRVVV